MREFPACRELSLYNNNLSGVVPALPPSVTLAILCGNPNLQGTVYYPVCGPNPSHTPTASPSPSPSHVSAGNNSNNTKVAIGVGVGIGVGGAILLAAVLVVVFRARLPCGISRSSSKHRLTSVTVDMPGRQNLIPQLIQVSAVGVPSPAPGTAQYSSNLNAGGQV